MASRSLGQLTLDVVAKIGGYTAGLDKAEKEAKKRAAAIEKAFDGAATAVGVAFGAMAVAATAAFTAIQAGINVAADFQDLAEETGASAEALASLAVAAGTAGVDMSSVAAASIKLTKSLVGVDDESKAAGAALTALGIPIEEFKRLAPEEQIDRLSKAFAQFEDGAGKTAVALDLWGKSGAEQLKVMKALEEQGGRTNILTTEQIKLADDFADAQAKALTELKLYSAAAATEFIPTINAVISVAKDLIKETLGISDSMTQLERNQAIRNFAENTVAGLARIADLAQIVARGFAIVGNAIGATAATAGFLAQGEFMNAARTQINGAKDLFNQVVGIGDNLISDRLKKAQAAQKQIAAITQAPLPALNYGGRTTGGGARGSRAGGGRSSARAPVDEAQRYLEGLQKQLEKTQELSVQEQLLQDIQMGRLGKVSEAQKDALLSVAGQIDAAKALEAQEKANNKAVEEQLKLRQQLEEEGARFTESFLTPQEKNAKAIENVNRLLDEGVISMETATRAIQSYRKEVEESNKQVEEFDEFTKNAIKGSQDAIAGFLEDLASGSKKSFREIADDFAAMLVKLAAQSLAADLTKKLFGSAGGGEGGGWLSAISGLFGGARALGGPVISGRMYQVNERGPEVFEAANGNQYMMAPENGRVIPNGGGINQTLNVNIVGTPNPRTPTQIAQEVRRQTNTAARRMG